MLEVTPRSILLLCDDDPSHAGNVLDHLGAFREHSRHSISFLNPRTFDRIELLDLEEFDVVVIHYTLVVSHSAYLPPALAHKIAAFEGLKIQFIQDEYRWVDEITAAIRELGVDVLYTLVPQNTVPAIYGERLPRTDIVTTLAGFVPDGLAGRRCAAAAARPIDVGYRGRHVPYWLGRLGQDKIEIGRRFLQRPEVASLKLDIAWTESDRIYGRDWIRFLERCRTTLGTESGASIVDFSGDIEAAVTAYLADHPAASFDEVAERLLAPYEGNAVINVASPRIFEAAALRTGLVLFRGEYSGVVEPWEHYIPLDRDFSNIDEVVDAVRDATLVDGMTERAFETLVASQRYSLPRFVDSFDRLVDKRAPGPSQRPKTTFSQLGSGQTSRPARSGRFKSMVKAVAADHAVTRSAEARRLRLAYLRSDEARQLVSSKRFNEDLRKIALLGGVQQTRLRTYPSFVVVPIVSGDRLVLAGRRRTTANLADARARSADAVGALRSGSIRELVWHQAGLSLSVWLRLGVGLSAPIEVGYYGMNGVHHFSGLERLKQVLQPQLFDVIETALRPSPKMREGVELAPPLAELIGPVISLIARDPVRYLRQVVVALQFAARKPPVRELLRAYLSRKDVRANVNPLELLDDMVKLAMLERVAVDSRLGDGNPDRASLDISLRGESLRIRTSTLPAATAVWPSELGGVTRVVWDHSEFGGTLMVDPRTVTTFDDERGAHHFRAFEAACAVTGANLGWIVETALPPRVAG